MLLKRLCFTSFLPSHLILTDSVGDCIQIIQGYAWIEVGYGLGVPCFVIHLPFSESPPLIRLMVTSETHGHIMAYGHASGIE